MATAEKCENCGRHGGATPDGCWREWLRSNHRVDSDPEWQRAWEAECDTAKELRAQLARVTAESADHEAHWKAAEASAGGVGCSAIIPRGSGIRLCARPATWRPERSRYECDDCAVSA